MSRDALERGRQIARERYGRSETEPASDGEPVDVDAADAARDPDAGRLAAGQLARHQRPARPPAGAAAMTLDVDTAADIAARYGLGLPDAQALSMLADGQAHGEILASKFARHDQSDGSGTADRHRGIEAGRQRARDRYGEPS